MEIIIFLKTEEIPSSEYSTNETSIENYRLQTNGIKAEYEGPENDFANFARQATPGMTPLNNEFDPRHHYTGQSLKSK